MNSNHNSILNDIVYIMKILQLKLEQWTIYLTLINIIYYILEYLSNESMDLEPIITKMNSKINYTVNSFFSLAC